VLAEFFEYHNDQMDGEGLILPGNRKYKWNVFTSYNFSEGALKGLMVGGGYSWQSKQPVGVVNSSQIRYSNDYWNTNGMVGYRFGKFERFPWVKNLRLQLNVYNVTDDQEPQIHRYQSNDPAHPGYNVVLRMRTKEPRTWRLTASFDF
jgi:outer membrane receptor protein involved in Fe transport